MSLPYLEKSDNIKPAKDITYNANPSNSESETNQEQNSNNELPPVFAHPLIASPECLAELIKKSNETSDITIDGFALTKNSETRNILVHGATGTGKSQLIAKILDSIRKRGDRAIIYDKSGFYTSRFYQEGKDYILNPFDSRCQNWSLWDEARTVQDFENLAKSLITKHCDLDPFWINAARAVFAGAAFAMRDAEDRSMKKLLDFLFKTKIEDLKQYLSETDAARLASDKSEKASISIHLTLITNLKLLRGLPSTEKINMAPFCIRDWIANDKGQGWLFLTGTRGQLFSLKPLISMCLSMATSSLLSLPENPERRIWFVCDDFPTLNKQQHLPSALAESHKYGGCFVLGMQNLYEIERVYDAHTTEAIRDLLNTVFYFRSRSKDAAMYVSKNLGNQKIDDMRGNYSFSSAAVCEDVPISERRIITSPDFAAKITRLKDMQCYLKLPGAYPVALLNLKLECKKVQKSAPKQQTFFEKLVRLLTKQK